MSAAYGVAMISRREGTHTRASVGKGVQVLVRAPGRRADSTAAAVCCGRRGQFARPHAHLACGAFERRRRPQKGQSRRQWEGLSSTGVRTTVPQAVRGKRGGEEGGTSARADSESRGHVWPHGVTSNAPSSPPVKRRGRHVKLTGRAHLCQLVTHTPRRSEQVGPTKWCVWMFRPSAFFQVHLLPIFFPFLLLRKFASLCRVVVVAASDAVASRHAQAKAALPSRPPVECGGHRDAVPNT